MSSLLPKDVSLRSPFTRLTRPGHPYNPTSLLSAHVGHFSFITSIIQTKQLPPQQIQHRR